MVGVISVTVTDLNRRVAFHIARANDRCMIPLMNEIIVLEHLHHIRDQVDRTAEDVREIKTRVSGLERKVAELHLDFANVSSRLDSIEARVERVEKRLELQ